MLSPQILRISPNTATRLEVKMFSVKSRRNKICLLLPNYELCSKKYKNDQKKVAQNSWNKKRTHPNIIISWLYLTAFLINDKCERCHLQRISTMLTKSQCKVPSKKKQTVSLYWMSYDTILCPCMLGSISSTVHCLLLTVFFFSFIWFPFLVSRR